MTKRDDDVTPRVGADLRSRKTYASPQLVIYGNISQITKAVGKTGNTDGGAKKDQKNSAA